MNPATAAAVAAAKVAADTAAYAAEFRRLSALMSGK